MVKQFSFIAVFACEIDKEPDDKLILFVCFLFLLFVCFMYIILIICFVGLFSLMSKQDSLKISVLYHSVFIKKCSVLIHFVL